MKFYSILFFLLIVLNQCSNSTNTNNTVTEGSKKDCSVHSARIMFYNCENLFDTSNDEGEGDDEFTPEGRLNWTAERYNKKIENLASVIAKIMSESSVFGIGLCEIENQVVLEDLVATSDLAPFHLKIIHEESHDKRGIDVAFLYNPEVMTEISHEVYRPQFDDPDYSSRDILYVKGKCCNGKDLHIFVNHWPSRRDGEEISEGRRIVLANLLLTHINEIKKEDSKALIIAMGDFNDEPENKSMNTVLNASIYSDEFGKTNGLINLMYEFKQKGIGTITYQSNWNTFDQFVVSSSLYEGKKTDIENEGHAFNDRMVMFKDKNGNLFPNKTYGGDKYYGGYSDHLAVYTDLYFN